MGRSRWARAGRNRSGAHAKTPDNRFNDYGIGICLVGNLDLDRPTPNQIKSLVRLCTFLSQTYHIPPDHMLGHGETKPTDCPGRLMSVAEVRRLTMQAVAAGGGEQTVRTASRGGAVIGDR